MKILLDFICGLIIVIAAGRGIYKLINKNQPTPNDNRKPEIQINNELPNQSNTQTSNWDKCYEPQYLMTQNEKSQFRKILNWSKGKGLHVFTKVRLADLITPKGNNQKLFWKIQAKHLDFVICDENIKVKLIVELQDKSHNTPDRKERDEFVKQVLESCGYKIIQVYYITDEILNNALGIKEPTAETPVIEQS